MTLPDLNEFVAEPLLNFGIRSSGPRITAVISGSNADTLGLRAGDVVVRVNDRTASRDADLVELFRTYQPETRLCLAARDVPAVLRSLM